MNVLPTGTVTFLFTDIEGSTRLVQRLGAGHIEVFETHARLLREAAARQGGVEVGERGDGFFFVFASAREAVEASAAAQRSLAGYRWPPRGSVRVRMGLHTGEGTLGGNGYMGLEVHRAARIAGAGHGGQVLLSGASAALVRDGLPRWVSLRKLGLYRLQDFPQPEELFQLVIEGLQGEFPPPRTQGPASVRLPTPLTSFVGRERELGELQAELQKTRLLTLTGPGGIGKTRLSLQAAAEAAPAFDDGVFFVPLAQISDPSLLTAAVLSSLALPPGGDPSSALRAHLGSRRLLLVLDNFEQLLLAGPQVTEWLQAAPGLKVLVTSRAPLHVYGEREYPVPPLGLPSRSSGLSEPGEGPRSEAVQLFLARAAAARPDFVLTERNIAAVAEIAARLEGLPLAIELAAARVKIMPPEAILVRLSSRLSFLTGGARDLPDRLQTLRGAISWSYDLLEPPIQRLFVRLAVFHGGACLSEVEIVCRPAEELGLDTLEGLTFLLDHSLLKQGQEGGELRFSMLETIREFACGLLKESGERELLVERHSAVFLALAETARAHLTRTGRRTWLDRLEADVDNLRAALSHFLEAGEAVPALRMVGALWRFWLMRGHLQEGRDRAAEALRLPGGHPAERIGALSAAGAMAYWQTDAQAAKQSFGEAVEMARQLGDRKALALTLYDYGYAFSIAGDWDRALGLVEEGLAEARGLGEPAVLGELLCALGTGHYFARNPDAAGPLLEEALQALAGSDAAYVITWALGIRSALRLLKGDLEGAREDLRMSGQLFPDDEDLGWVSRQLSGYASLAFAGGEMERGFRLVGAAEAARTASRTFLHVPVEVRIPAVVEATARVGKQRAEELMAEGRLMPAKEALAYAREALGNAALTTVGSRSDQGAVDLMFPVPGGRPRRG
jgi:predicted ATPase/class 3 adenylate cyclase